MSSENACPKCNTVMEKGTLQLSGKFGESPFTWEDAGENRIRLVAYHCPKCGHIELNAPPKKVQ